MNYSLFDKHDQAAHEADLAVKRAAADRPPYVVGSETSTAAAASVADTAGGMRQRILELIRSHPDGLTCDAIEAALDLRHQTASARVTELRRMGLIRPEGKRKTRSGRAAVVWKSHVR